MELYLEPIWAKKDTKFQKGHIPWNKGVKGWTTRDPEKRRRVLIPSFFHNLKTKD